MAWTLIETVSLSGSASSVTLGSEGTIPQTFKSLKLLVSARSDRTLEYNSLKITFNGSSAWNYSSRYLNGTGSTALSGSTSSDTVNWYVYVDAVSATSNTYGNAEILIPNYATSANKAWSSDSVTENNGTVAIQTIAAHLWSQTAAITSITLTPDASASLIAGSTFTLYGLK